MSSAGDNSLNPDAAEWRPGQSFVFNTSAPAFVPSSAGTSPSAAAPTAAPAPAPAAAAAKATPVPPAAAPSTESKVPAAAAAGAPAASASANGASSGGRWERGNTVSSSAAAPFDGPSAARSRGADSAVWERGSRVAEDTNALDGAAASAGPAAAGADGAAGGTDGGSSWRSGSRTVGAVKVQISASGRRVYPLGALLQLRPVTQPELPAACAIPELSKGRRPQLLRSELSEGAGRQGGDRRGGERGGAFGPRDGRSGRGRPGAGRGGAVDTAPALEDCKPLEINEETRWKSKVMGAGGDQDRVEELGRRLRALLNKLTLELFGKISAQIAAIEVGSEEELAAFANAVVLKAQGEHHFCAMYAELCAVLSARAVLDDDPSKPRRFRTALLGRCQQEFETDLATRMAGAEQEAAEKELPPEDRDLLLIRTKRHYLGHMKFLGELYLKGLLKEKIVHEVISILFGEEGDDDEERIECLCKLLTTVGETLEKSTSKEKYLKLVTLYFQHLDKMGDDKALPSRTRFMCKDVVELRRSGYVSRREELVAKTVTEIRAEAEREQRLMEARKAHHGNGRDRRDRRDRDRGGSGRDGYGARSSRRDSNRSRQQPVVDEDGWAVVGGYGRSARGGGGRAPADARQSERDGGDGWSTVEARGGGGSGGRGGFSMLAAMEDDERRAKKDKKKKKKKERKEEDAAAGAAGKGEVDATQALSNAWQAVEEFGVNNDEAELIECLREAAASIEGSAAGEIVGKSLEKKDAVRETAQRAIAAAAAAGVKGFDAAGLAGAMGEQLEFLWDIKIDVPMVEQYMVAFIAPLLKGGHLPLSFLQVSDSAMRRHGAHQNLVKFFGALRPCARKAGVLGNGGAGRSRAARTSNLRSDAGGMRCAGRAAGPTARPTLALPREANDDACAPSLAPLPLLRRPRAPQDCPEGFRKPAGFEGADAAAFVARCAAAACGGDAAAARDMAGGFDWATVLPDGTDDVAGVGAAKLDQAISA